MVERIFLYLVFLYYYITYINLGFLVHDNDVVVIYVLYVAIVYLSSKNSFRCNI